MQLRRGSLVRVLITSLVLSILPSGFGLSGDPGAAAATQSQGLSAREFSQRAGQLDGLVENLRIGAFSTSSAGDATGDGEVTVADIFYLINYLFAGGPAPASVAAGGDLSGTYPNPAVASVGGQTAASVAEATVLANAATSVPTPDTIVKRDAAGGFSAGTITASLSGNATTATSAVDFSGVLEGDVTGKQDETVIAPNRVVKSINALRDDVTIAAGVNTSISTADGTITIESSAALLQQRAALLRWYSQSFPTSNPYGLAFDGSNIWVANFAGGTVTKLRASDGACVGTCIFPLPGENPQGLAFDGANIWVTNLFLSGDVTRLRASDGACVGTCTFDVGSTPIAVAFDGANIWVANRDSGDVTKLRASDGACVDPCTFPTGGNPQGIAFDGANIWVANVGSDSVTKLRASDGACVGTCTFPVGDAPRGIAFDGANIWVANFGSDNVTKLRASDGACVNPFICTIPAGDGPYGIAFDGANIWVTNANAPGSTDTVTKLRASDGANLGTFTVGDQPLGVVFDGVNIWVSSSLSNQVTKL